MQPLSHTRTAGNGAVRPAIASGNRSTALAALLSLSLFDAATIAGVHVERISLLGFRVGSTVLDREEAIDALAALLARVHAAMPDATDALRWFGLAGVVTIRGEVSSMGPRVVVLVRICSSTLDTVRADRASALGIVRDILRGAGLNAQRDLDRGIVLVTAGGVA